MGSIYHIALTTDWERARPDGHYRMSTRGRTLDEQGFIHASRAHQVAPVANAFYRGEQGGLLVLEIDEDRVAAEIRYEPVPGEADPFPHIYGPLNVEAVVGTSPLEPGPDGSFTFPAGGETQEA